mgnify:CR=1 FL=1
MEATLSQEVRQEDLKALREMLDSRGWQLLQDHLEKLSTRKEMELAGLLRSGKLQEAYAMQAWIDGFNHVTRTTLDLTIRLRGQFEENPSY